MKKSYVVYILILSLVGIISHLNWFCFGTILNNNDWGFWPNETTRQLYNSYGTWINFFGFGSPNLQIYFNFFTFFWSLITNLGFSYDNAAKLTFLIPIALFGFISPFILLKKVIKDSFISFIVALFYGTTTYFLVRQTAHIPVSFLYAIAPLIIYFFINANENNKLHNWVIFVLLYWIGACYEIRITYIITFIIFIYYLLFHIKDIKKNWKYILLSVFLFVGLNFFWIFPTMSGKFSEGISLVTDRNLFGNFLFDIFHAFTIFDSSWTGGTVNSQFIKQPVIWRFWFLPLIAFLSFLLSKKNKYKKNVVFFGIISLIGIFLTKQSGSPFESVYGFLYLNFPGFNLFREASKFYLITAIGYTGLLGYALLLLKESGNKIFNKYLFIGFSIIILSISFFNIKPLINGEIKTMFIPRHIPNDYLVLKNFILKEPEYFRTLWIPRDSSWSIYTNQKPKIRNVNAAGGNWKNLLETFNENEELVQNRIINVFKLSSANNLFDASSIKYVIVPLQDIANDNDFYIYYGGMENKKIREWYIAELDRIEWLKKIDIETNELIVYENENYQPHIYSNSGLNYYQTNASEFGDFSQNQNFYLNSDIQKKNYLLDKLDNIIIPIEADLDKIAEMQSEIDKTTDSIEKKGLQSNLDLYKNNSFLKDFKLKVPTQATYKIYFKAGSVLANNKDIGIQIDDRMLREDESGSDKEGWKYFNQIALDKGEFGFKLYAGNELINYINSGDIVLSAEDLIDPIQAPRLEYKQINPTKYIVNVHGAKESFPLIFSESFHPGWKIYVKPELSGQGSGKFISENNQGTIQNENLDGGRFYDLLFRKPVLDDKHFLINSFANAWWIDLDEIKNSKIKGLKNYIENSDGSIDFSIIIEFEPQKYFYAGLAISITTLLGCLGYLAFAWRKARSAPKI